MSSTTNIVEDQPEKPIVSHWRQRFNFPCGAKLLILYQLLYGMGNYCYILSMPIYMASMLKFSDATSTTIYHAKSGLGTILNIFGAILADSFIGRSKTYMYISPFGIFLIGTISVLSIYSQKEGILISYFLIAIIGGLIGPAIRAIICDQISQNNKVMLGTYMHIIYLINNFGVIIIAYCAPIMHKDIYCFGMECYPLVFLVSFLLAGIAFLLFVLGFCLKLFVIFKPTNNLMLDIFRCIHLAVKKRIALGKPPKGSTWFDYTSDQFSADFIRDIKIAKGLLVFLLAHPIFWTVFEQLSSIWTLQAQYMDGMLSDTFVIKANQMQTLNPILVVVLIPIFELLIYPILSKINFKVPYRIMMGQVFTVFACISMIFIQIKIDQVIVPKTSVTGDINIVNLANSNISYKLGSDVTLIPKMGSNKLTVNGSNFINITSQGSNLYISTNSFINKINTITIYDSNLSLNFTSAEVSRQTNGGYADVRIFNNIDTEDSFNIFLKAKVGINKDFELTSSRYQFGKYAKCGIGVFEVFFRKDSINRKISEITLYPAETKTLMISGNLTQTSMVVITELRLILPTIIWQILPYIMVTIGEVLFNVNTGIFLYGEAPLSMKSMLLAAEYTCIALGNIFILVLRQVLGDLSMVYLFLICGILVAISALFTGLLGYFYLKNQTKNQPAVNDSHASTEL